jgi:nucleoside 2-deoxyribosyltransferase
MALTMHQKPGKEERMADWRKCPVCGSPAIVYKSIKFKEIECYRCGRFILRTGWQDEVNPFTNDLSRDTRALISKWIYTQKEPPTIDRDIAKNIAKHYLPNLKEKTDLFIERIASTNPFAGHHIDLNEDNIKAALDILEACDYGSVKINESVKPVFKYFAHCFIYDTKEFRYIWKSLCDQNLLSEERPKKEITPAGWEYIQQLRARNPKSKKAFVAMWFDDNLRSVYEEYISEAVKSCGFKAERVDYVEHNDLIIDRILSSINSSRFVIADFTGNRAGVYYEAGYARGLNIPVIYTCNNSWFNANHSTTITVPIDSSSQSVEVEASFGTQIHFDLLQQNFLLWENGEDLKEKLINRINATINRPDQI